MILLEGIFWLRCSLLKHWLKLSIEWLLLRCQVCRTLLCLFVTPALTNFVNFETEGFLSYREQFSVKKIYSVQVTSKNACPRKFDSCVSFMFAQLPLKDLKLKKLLQICWHFLNWNYTDSKPFFEKWKCLLFWTTHSFFSKLHFEHFCENPQLENRGLPFFVQNLWNISSKIRLSYQPIYS